MYLGLVLASSFFPSGLFLCQYHAVLSQYLCNFKSRIGFSLPLFIQDCLYYFGSLLVPQEFQDHFLQFHEECCWNFYWDCGKFMYLFWKYGHFDYVCSAYPRIWDIFPYSNVFLNLLFQSTIAFIVVFFHFLRLISRYLIFLHSIRNGIFP